MAALATTASTTSAMTRTIVTRRRLDAGAGVGVFDAVLGGEVTCAAKDSPRVRSEAAAEVFGAAAGSGIPASALEG